MGGKKDSGNSVKTDNNTDEDTVEKTTTDFEPSAKTKDKFISSSLYSRDHPAPRPNILQRDVDNLESSGVSLEHKQN